MSTFDPHAYGPVLGPLLDSDRRRPLDAGTLCQEHQIALHAVEIGSLFGRAEVVDPEMATLCLAGLWLLYDGLDESHALSQSVKTSSGSFWHGIMHRREGDYSNAKYWFRQTGSHPVLDQLAAEAPDHGFTGTAWDPFGFVDACQVAVAGGGNAETCLVLQQREWELLFDHCFRRAVGN